MANGNKDIILSKAEEMSLLTEEQAKINGLLLSVKSTAALMVAELDKELDKYFSWDKFDRAEAIIRLKKDLDELAHKVNKVNDKIVDLKKSYLGERYEQWYRKYYWGE